MSGRQRLNGGGLSMSIVNPPAQISDIQSHFQLRSSEISCIRRGFIFSGVQKWDNLWSIDIKCGFRSEVFGPGNAAFYEPSLLVKITFLGSYGEL